MNNVHCVRRDDQPTLRLLRQWAAVCLVTICAGISAQAEQEKDFVKYVAELKTHIEKELTSVSASEKKDIALQLMKKSLSSGDELRLRLIIRELRDTGVDDSVAVRRIYYHILENTDKFHLGLQGAVMSALLRRSTYDAFDIEGTEALLKKGNWSALQILINWRHCDTKGRIEKIYSDDRGKDNGVVSIFPKRIREGTDYSREKLLGIPSRERVYISDLLKAYYAMCGDEEARDYLVTQHKNAEPPPFGEMRSPEDRDSTYWYSLLYIAGHEPAGDPPKPHPVL